MGKEEKIKKLEEAGAKRWTKDGMDRLYINPEILGFIYEKYKTGRIAYAELNGEKISNNRMTKILFGKTYIDINDNFSVHTEIKDQDYLDALKEFTEKMIYN